jgi:MoxR-like ATPase
VVPEDVKAVGHGALRHRVLLSYEAEARELDSDAVVTMLLENIEVP